MSEIAQYRGTGKRKTSVARVILRPGDGGTWINGRTLEEYFPREALRSSATAPLRVAGLEGRFDLWARLDGGGIAGKGCRSEHQPCHGRENHRRAPDTQRRQPMCSARGKPVCGEQCTEIKRDEDEHSGVTGEIFRFSAYQCEHGIFGNRWCPARRNGRRR